MKKILFVYPRFSRHAQHHPELLDAVPMNEYLGSPSLGIASVAAVTPDHYELEFWDDRIRPADRDTDADLVALSFFTPAARRGLELADHFKALGKTVVAGGIFPTMIPDEVQPHVDAVVVCEGEASWPRLLADLEAGRLAPRYSPGGPVDLTQVPLPRVDLYFQAETETAHFDDYPVQSARGCPLNCSACVLPTSMTRNQRGFPFEHLLGQLDQLGAAGKRACLTEDTGWFPGEKGRRATARLLEHLRDHGNPAEISYVGISMPMILSTPAHYFTLAREAGIKMFYLVGGFDPVTRGAFTGQDQKSLQRAEDAIAKCHDVGIEPYTSFLLGQDFDDLGAVDRILDFAERTRIKKAEFAIFTPYPGTPSWHQLVAEDRIISRDWSRYNDANVVFRPAQMTPDELLQGYLRLWREFYSVRGHLADLPVAERTIQF